MILDALHKQVNTSASFQQAGRSSLKEDQKETNQKEKSQVPTQKDDFPDLFLPARKTTELVIAFVVTLTVYLQTITRWF